MAVFEEQTNNISQRDLTLYDKQFLQLFTHFQKYLPQNLKFSYSRVGDVIPKKKIDRLLDLKVVELRKNWDKQTKEAIEYKLLRAKRNSIWNPKDKNLDKVILRSALVHDAFCSECWTTEAAPWDKKNMITLGHNYTTGWAIHVRSAQGSSVNFWSGIGVLEQRNLEYIPTVLSPNQYDEVKEKIRRVKVDVFGKRFPNLVSVPVLVR